MGTWHEVSCITTANRNDPQEQITHIGGHNAKGRGWRLSIAEAIDGMISGKWSFFVNVNGRRHALVVAVSRRGSRFVKTEFDSAEPMTLLNLPHCAGVLAADEFV
jgi:hypothetical protein